MVFQEPNSVLNPVYTIGWQIEEGLRAHGMKDKKELRAKSIDILKKVGIPDAETRIDYYPHQFSGGQKQRVAIAGVVAMRPDCLILDEATAMLDPRGREQVMQTIHYLNRNMGITVVSITHYMGRGRAGRPCAGDEPGQCGDGRHPERGVQPDRKSPFSPPRRAAGRRAAG